VPSTPGPEAELDGLTWEGHEFLDKVRHDTVWKAITSEAKEKGLSATIGILSQLADKYIKKQLGL
jgi:hypothetical protein